MSGFWSGVGNLATNTGKGLWEGLSGGVTALTGTYSPEEKKQIAKNGEIARNRVANNPTTLGDAVQIVGRKTGMYNTSYFNVIILALVGFVILKILD